MGQLAQLGARSLSTGINDPYTAAACIDHLSAALVNLAGRGLPRLVRTGKDGKGRLIVPGPSFKLMLESGFTPLREYGATHTIVVRRLALALRRIAAATVRSEDRQAVQAELALLIQSAEQSIGHTPQWPSLKAELLLPRAEPRD